MAEWLAQNRSEIKGLSTKALIEWAKDEVYTARHFARVDNPERSPADMLRSASSAVEIVFDDGPAAVVMGETGLSRAGVVAALNSGWFDTVISGFDQAIRVGSEREKPAGAALAAPSIQREAAEDTALSVKGKVPAFNLVSEKIEAAGQRVGAAEVGLVSTVQSLAPRSAVSERIDRVQDAAQRYWQAATASGRQTIAAKDQTSQQQAGWTARQEVQTGVTREA